VPLTIIHRKGLTLDGNNPTLISGYGSYGFGSNVNFNPVDLAWFERGGVRAIAHVRGGGEHGKQWHLAGQKLNKPNTWKDFIACAHYLIDNKYTSKEKIAGQGGSAGGILIGRAITERPDLFAAALLNVGALDAVRFETTMNGPPNVPEFGSVKTEDGFKGLYAMSAYHHVKDGEKYPAVMLTHGVNDPRVDPWMSAKMCARLQAASTSGKPVLFRVDYVAGHGIGSTRTQQEQLTADQWGFLLWQMGDADFQPK
jgi:prolyl oligopeptidase